MKKAQKKRINLGAILLLLVLTLSLQPTPAAQAVDLVANYSFTAVSGVFTPLPLGGTYINLDAGDADEGYANSLPIGFNFNFLGTTYTHFGVSTNGWMTIGNGSTAIIDASYDNTNAPNIVVPTIMPLWDDLDTTSGSMGYQLDGSAGNQTLTVQWLNMEWDYATDTPVISFQVKLYEANGQIEFIYQQEAGAVDVSQITSGGATIGLAATTTGDYLVLSDTSAAPTASSTVYTSNIATKPATHQTYRFTPPLKIANDNLANATDVSNLSNPSYNEIVDLTDATFEVNEQPCAGANDTKSVWYKFTPMTIGKLTVIVAPTTAQNDVTVGVFTGADVHPVNVTTCKNDFGPGLSEGITNLDVTPIFNWIRVSALSTSTPGSTSVNISFTPAAPPNDNLANAIDVTGDVTNQIPYNEVVDTTNATKEANETICNSEDGGDNNSVWYKVTPTQNGRLTIETTPTNDTIDPTVGIFTGTGHPLTEVNCMDDNGKDEDEDIIEQAVTANTTYSLRVAGLGTAVGSTDVVISFKAGFSVYLPLMIKGGSSGGTGSWQAQTSTVTTKLNNIDCPTTTFCVAVGDGGKVVTTADGGTTWSSKPSGVTANLNDVSCIDQAICVAVGDGGTIIYSNNSGATWSSKTSGTTQNLRGAGCATNTCFASGGTGTSTGVFSLNGGTSWIPSPVSLGNTDLYGAACPNDGTCTVVGLGGRVLVFAGTGVKNLHNSLSPNIFEHVDCPTDQICVIAGDNGTIFTTSDGGANFTQRTSGVATNLEGVSCSGTTCYAAGDGGKIITSANSGTSWSAETTGVTTNLNGISCSSPTTCYAVGDGGAILAKK